MADFRGGALTLRDDGKARCDWKVDWDAEPEFLQYHDEEWGIPRREPAVVFEALSLGVFQAGLGWLTVLHKRPAFREAFHGFDPVAVAAMTERDVEALLGNAAIIRNRAKIEATIANAVVATTSDTDLADLMWRFAPAEHRSPENLDEVPTASDESRALASALKTAGYTFVGPTSVYAFMQSLGIVNDHVRGCFRAPGAGSAVDS
jgi:DNA-3-methyladenine glycosylase I